MPPSGVRYTALSSAPASDGSAGPTSVVRLACWPTPSTASHRRSPGRSMEHTITQRRESTAALKYASDDGSGVWLRAWRLSSIEASRLNGNPPSTCRNPPDWRSSRWSPSS